MASKPQVADYINFYLTNVNEEVRNVGYFPAAADASTRPGRAGSTPWGSRERRAALPTRTCS
jgi:hypothetical protein